MHLKRWSLIFAAVILTGCSATNSLTLSVLEPAEVSLAPGIDRVGVMSRSQSGGNSGALETLDQIFSLKGPELDSLGALTSQSALADELEMNDRFVLVERIEAGKTNNPTYGTFPAPLSWEQVEQLSEEYDVEAIFSLEFYNTDSDISYSTRRVMVEGPLGVQIPALEHLASVETMVTGGWRIYDVEARLVLDEFIQNNRVITSGSGINPAEAVKAVTGRTEAVQAISRDMGLMYADRIVPFYTRVRREYFVKGHDLFELAQRRAQTGNWDGAGDIWLRLTDHSDRKIAGRAHYNMGIISEINGDLDEAIMWVRTAYEDYGEKKALDYLRVLQNRVRRNELLNEQQSY